jgi:hypothetical protein
MGIKHEHSFHCVTVSYPFDTRSNVTVCSTVAEAWGDGEPTQCITSFHRSSSKMYLGDIEGKL